MNAQCRRVCSNTLTNSQTWYSQYSQGAKLDIELIAATQGWYDNHNSRSDMYALVKDQYMMMKLNYRTGALVWSQLHFSSSTMELKYRNYGQLFIHQGYLYCIYSLYEKLLYLVKFILKIDKDNGKILTSIKNGFNYKVYGLHENEPHIWIAGRINDIATIQQYDYQTLQPSLTKSYRIIDSGKDIQIFKLISPDIAMAYQDYRTTKNKAYFLKINLKSRLIIEYKQISIPESHLRSKNSLKDSNHLYFLISFAGMHYFVGKFNLTTFDNPVYVNKYQLEKIGNQFMVSSTQNSEGYIYISMVQRHTPYWHYISKFDKEAGVFVLVKRMVNPHSGYYHLMVIDDDIMHFIYKQKVFVLGLVTMEMNKFVDEGDDKEGFMNDDLKWIQVPNFKVTQVVQITDQQPKQITTLTKVVKMVNFTNTISDMRIDMQLFYPDLRNQMVILDHNQTFSVEFPVLICPVDSRVVASLIGDTPSWMLFNSLTSTLTGTAENPSFKSNLTIELIYQEQLIQKVYSKVIQIIVRQQVIKPVDPPITTSQSGVQSSADKSPSYAHLAGVTLGITQLLVEIIKRTLGLVSMKPSLQNSMFFLNAFQMLLTTLHFNLGPQVTTFIKGFSFLNLDMEFMNKVGIVNKTQRHLDQILSSEQRNPIFREKYEVQHSSTILYYFKAIMTMLIFAIFHFCFNVLCFMCRYIRGKKSEVESRCGKWRREVWEQLLRLLNFDIYLVVFENAFWFMLSLSINELTWMEWSEQRVSYSISVGLLIGLALVFLLVIPYQSIKHCRARRPLTKRLYWSVFFDHLKPSPYSMASLWVYFYSRRVYVVLISAFLHRSTLLKILLYYLVQLTCIVYFIIVRPFKAVKDNLLMISSELGLFLFVHTIIVYEYQKSDKFRAHLDWTSLIFLQVVIISNQLIVLIFDIGSGLKSFIQGLLRKRSQKYKIHDKQIVERKINSPKQKQITAVQVDQSEQSIHTQCDVRFSFSSSRFASEIEFDLPHPVNSPSHNIDKPRVNHSQFYPDNPNQ